MQNDTGKPTKLSRTTLASVKSLFLLYTDGLGPCIGVCIAWDKWAGLLHSADIFMDEEDVVAELIQKAKKVIPATTISRIHPVLCGGDTHDPSEIDDDPEEHAVNVLRCRARIIEILKDAGFGKPHVRWNGSGQTATLSADLMVSEVYVEHDGVEVGRWKIPKKAPSANPISNAKKPPKRTT